MEPPEGKERDLEPHLLYFLHECPEDILEMKTATGSAYQLVKIARYKKTQKLFERLTTKKVSLPCSSF